MLHGLLSENQEMQGILFDLPGVVSGARALQTRAISNRCEIMGGDFFQEVPRGADVYILKGIIHDCDNEYALKILKNCHSAISPNGRLLLMELVYESSTTTEQEIFHDLMMLTLLGGRERTETEFKHFLKLRAFLYQELFQ